MKKSTFMTGIVLVLLTTFAIKTNGQTTATLFPVKDNTLIEDPTGNLSNGGGMYFFAGKVGGAGGFTNRRGVLAFDVAGTIPAGALITSATLVLEKTKGGSGSNFIEIHRLTKDWGEGTSIGPMGEGAGAPATPNDATWLCTFHNGGGGGCTSSWTAPGGDYVGAISTFSTVTANGSYTFPSIPQLVADVQNMLDNPANDFGWIVTQPNSPNGGAVRFNTKDNNNPNTHPMLIVEYVGCINGNPQNQLVDIEGNADVHGSLNVQDVLRLKPRACEPDTPVEGMIYYDLGLKKLRVYDGTAWQDCW